MSKRSHHFYVAFNPLFNQDSPFKTQAHEFYHELKKKVSTKHKSHMYWGKLKLSEFSESLDLSNFYKVLGENKASGVETHLFISDYQHLWVAKVEDVAEDIVDYENTLEFYREKNVEVWFKITDFDLVSQNTNDTTKALSQLYVENGFYNYKLKEISPFSTGLRFPMIVQDKSDKRYFRDFNQSLSHRLKIPNHQIESPVEAFKVREISQSYVIPERNFKRLSPTVRSQLMSAEILLVESTVAGDKSRLKLEQSILTYLRCLEILLNETFIQHIKNEQGNKIFVTATTPPKCLRTAMEKDNHEILLLKDSKVHFSIGHIKMLMDAPSFFPHTTLDWTFRNKKKFWEFCRLELRHILKNEGLAELKNTLTSGGKVAKNERELLFVRNILLGVGDKGVFNDIIEHYYDSEFDVENTREPLQSA